MKPPPYRSAFARALVEMHSNQELRREWIAAMVAWEVDRDIDWTPEQTNEFLEKLNCDRFGKMLDRIEQDMMQVEA